MVYLLIILIVGINTAPFIFPQLDIWHAQGIWIQACILVLFSTTFLVSPKYKENKNIELGLIHLWIGLQTAFICFVAQTKGKYDITHFFPYFNFLCLLILYKFIVQYLNSENAITIMRTLKYVLVATLVMCGLQFFGAAQFFKMFHPDDVFHNNPIVGFIGNGTHLSGFLAMMIPVFLYFGKREDYLCLTLIAILMCFTGTSSNDPSVSGWIVALFVIGLWAWYIKRLYFYILLGASVVCGISLYLYNAHFFTSSGRLGVWSYYLPLIKKWFITGTGLGTMNAVYKDSANPGFRHLHMEYLQALLEVGLIGVILIINLIKKFFEYRVVNRLQLSYKLIFLGFCVSACFNYPAHLWLTATIACIAYALFMVIDRGANYAS